ncbi:hypothetical protein T492DRAFT_1140196 [Pavlovales sp. CCMP2436]|nr:hypothetical protein T492DRAFT_1140196 [Pavlovales sp. CCMP2436]|mmetsp:Transcript_6656/g.17346  ORF Transcript_6656/g.17346 Transcript_6656/m.17346 type:complete len:230 (-) Transcript_6656:128-817(-)
MQSSMQSVEESHVNQQPPQQPPQQQQQPPQQLERLLLPRPGKEGAMEEGLAPAESGSSARGCAYTLSTDWPLFLKKSLFVVVLSYSLVPLIAFKHKLPAAMFALGLVVLHVLILVVYLWRVRIRQLDPDWRAFGARLMAIGVASYLLDLATKLEGGTDVLQLCANMAVLCAAHCLVLALLTVRVVRADQPLSTEPLIVVGDCEPQPESGLVVLAVTAAGSPAVSLPRPP